MFLSNIFRQGQAYFHLLSSIQHRTICCQMRPVDGGKMSGNASALHVSLYLYVKDLSRYDKLWFQQSKYKFYRRKAVLRFTYLLLCSIVQVNDCETESSLCSATLSHAAPSSQGMAKVQDGHTNACDRYAALLRTQTLGSSRILLLMCVCVCVSAALQC